jgi:hypothetical protein
VQHLCRSNRFDQCFCSDLIVLSAKDDITGNTKGVGGAYNVDEVLQCMVHGLNEELEMRMGGMVTTATTITANNNNNNNLIMDERGQVINKDEYYPDRNFASSQTMALGQDI